MATRFVLITSLGALLAIPALSQDPNTPPPGRVARLGYFAGTVSFQPAGIDDWAPAELNHPVTTGDHLWTEADGIAELQTDNAEMRMGGSTNFSFVNLNDAVTQIQITTGTVNVRLHTLAPGEGFEIDTPQLSFTLNRNGDYRVDVNATGDATLAMVRTGDATINIGEQATEVAPGTQVRVSGGDNPVVDQPVQAPALDQFDAFCAQRDQRDDAAISARYISRDLPGYADLDDGGVWRYIPPYGNVWFPTGLQPDWAPYQYGHWLSTPEWGWTWVDDAAWGWTPFHYGRWVALDTGWGWVPAMPITVLRPVFAPALVVFSDFDPGVVVADGVIGWFPLGFGEVYVPPFAVGVTGLAAFNIGISVGAGYDPGSAHYAYRDRMVAMRHGDFEHGRAMHGYRDGGMRVPRDRMDRGHLRANAGRRPDREAIRGRGDAHGHVPPRSAMNRSVHRDGAAARREMAHNGGARENERGRVMANNHGAAAREANRGPMNRGGMSRGPVSRGEVGRSGSPSRGPVSRGPVGRSGSPSREPVSRGPVTRSGSPSRGTVNRGPSPARGPVSSPGRTGGNPGMGGRPGGTPGGGRPGGMPGGGRPGGAVPHPTAPAPKKK